MWIINFCFIQSLSLKHSINFQDSANVMNSVQPLQKRCRLHKTLCDITAIYQVTTNVQFLGINLLCKLLSFSVSPHLPCLLNVHALPLCYVYLRKLEVFYAFLPDNNDIEVFLFAFWLNILWYLYFRVLNLLNKLLDYEQFEVISQVVFMSLCYVLQALIENCVATAKICKSLYVDIKQLFFYQSPYVVLRSPCNDLSVFIM